MSLTADGFASMVSYDTQGTVCGDNAIDVETEEMIRLDFSSWMLRQLADTIGAHVTARLEVYELR